MHGRADISILELLPDREGEWDHYVQSHFNGSFFHLSGWRHVIERSFGHRSFFLMAIDGGNIVGVLPLVHIKSRLFGAALISNAFCVYGGPLADRKDIYDALNAAAISLARRLKVGHLEYRLRQIPDKLKDWDCRSDLYVTFRKSISGDNEENLKAIPRKQRAVVRKAIKAGLEGRKVEDPDLVYDIYAQSVRNLGTPVFHRRYFHILKEVFGDTCELLVIEKGSEGLAAVMSFYFKDEVLPYYGGGTRKARSHGANDFMYWEVMRRAADKGIGLFDFGRSKRGTGAFNFKKYWGFEATPLCYAYHLVNARSVPETNPLNPKYQLAIKTWRRLPVWLTMRLGPPIARSLG